jgi:hypothetical protein
MGTDREWFELDPPSTPDAEDNNTLYVSPSGSDSNTGASPTAPLKTIAAAVAALRAASGGPKQIFLREGTFHLQKTVLLTEKDNGLTISNYDGEEVWLSGAAVLSDLAWTKHDVSKDRNIWKTALQKSQLKEMPALRVCASRPNSSFDETSDCINPIARAIRAVYPNHVPELGFGSDLLAKAWHPQIQAPNESLPMLEFYPPVPFREGSANESWVCVGEGITQFCRPFYTNYHLGVGGECTNQQGKIDRCSCSQLVFLFCWSGRCNQFSPPAGYWCYDDALPENDQPQGGVAAPYGIPSGLTFDQKTLPNSPYKNATGAVVHAWMSDGHWASWFFEVDKFNDTALMWTKGGEYTIYRHY